MRISYLFCFLFFWSCGEPSNDAATSAVLEQQAVVGIPTIKPKVQAAIVYDYDTSKWLDLSHVDTNFIIDMKYATTDNFVGEKMYDCSRCFLRPKVAKQLKKAQEEFMTHGFQLLLLDCYRPRPIQQLLWDKFPNPSYVTPPSRGSMHNRGKAVDLTFVDKNGQQLEMGSPYDYFGKEAHHTYLDLPKEILDRRILLKETLAKYGFQGIRTEWWHYSYSDVPFGLSDWLWECK